MWPSGEGDGLEIHWGFPAQVQILPTMGHKPILQPPPCKHGTQLLHGWEIPLQTYKVGKLGEATGPVRCPLFCLMSRTSEPVLPTHPKQLSTLHLKLELLMSKESLHNVALIANKEGKTSHGSGILAALTKLRFRSQHLTQAETHRLWRQKAGHPVAQQVEKNAQAAALVV